MYPLCDVGLGYYKWRKLYMSLKLLPFENPILVFTTITF